MSTTFGIHKLGKQFELQGDQLPEYITFLDETFTEVARRYNGHFAWLNDLAKFLPEDMKVYPLDNTAQGIYTIGDLKREINL